MTFYEFIPLSWKLFILLLWCGSIWAFVSKWWIGKYSKEDKIVIDFQRNTLPVLGWGWLVFSILTILVFYIGYNLGM